MAGEDQSGFSPDDRNILELLIHVAIELYSQCQLIVWYYDRDWQYIVHN